MASMMVGGEKKTYDIELAKRCVDLYSKSASVPCTLLDADAVPVYSSSQTGNHCTLCAFLKKLTGRQVHCSNSALYGSYQAERFGGMYIYFCPNGLVNWVSPITISGSIRGALLGGPVLMIDPNEFVCDELLAKNEIDLSHAKEAMDEVAKIPYVETQRVSALAEMLFITSTHISDLEHLQYVDQKKSQNQQSAISEYIKRMKTENKLEASNLSMDYLFEKEKELSALISSGDKHTAQSVLNELLGYILLVTGNDFNVIKARVLELVVMLSRAAMDGGADAEQIFGLNYKYLNEINQFKNIEDLCFWLSKIIIRFTDYVFDLVEVKHVDVIYKALDFVKQNYMHKITLEDVAQHVFLSPSYFSKVFKEEMNCNFNTYLNGVRIEQSKKLLLSDKVNLIDVSNMTGFEDQSYFSKVFKRITGTTPGKFREKRGKVKNLQDSGREI